MPNTTSSANTADGPTAATVFDSVISMADEAAGATGTSGWTYEDGSAWDPASPDIVFSPGPCGTLAAGGDRRFLQFALMGPPAAVSPADARERMREYLEENGFEVTKSMDPPPGNEPKNTYEVAGRRTDGAIVDYGANNAEQVLNLRSQCSAHPSMKDEVSAETP